MNKVISGLVNVLLDQEATLSERDDAAMDLSDYDNDESLAALVKVGSSIDESPTLQSSCGESIASIWKRRKAFDPDVYARLTASARAEIDASRF